MNSEDFGKNLSEVIDKVQRVLGGKAAEYASDSDRLANFRRQAMLNNQTIPEALRGNMSKHTVSIFDMLSSGRTYPLGMWDEKIIDHINYLILLRAVVIESSEFVEEIPVAFRKEDIPKSKEFALAVMNSGMGAQGLCLACDIWSNIEEHTAFGLSKIGYWFDEHACV